MDTEIVYDLDSKPIGVSIDSEPAILPDEILELIAQLSAAYDLIKGGK